MGGHNIGTDDHGHRLEYNDLCLVEIYSGNHIRQVSARFVETSDDGDRCPFHLCQTCISAVGRIYGELRKANSVKE